MDTLAQVAVKAFANGSLTPHAWRRRPLTREEILGSKRDRAPADAVHALLAGRRGGGARRLPARGTSTRLPAARPGLAAVGRLPDARRPGSFEVFSPSLALEISPSPTVDAAREAFEVAGVEPADVDVVQVQDTESGAELIHLAECGLCEHGEQPALYAEGATRIDGRLPVNTDGGCLANGEPVGASGLRQVVEIVTQLRGEAGARQVPGDPRVWLHARLRRAGCQRVHRAQPLTARN